MALTLGLFNRLRTGKGMYIDFSIIEGAMTLLGPHFLDFEVNQRRTRRGDFPPGNRSLFPPLAPHNTYRCLGRDRLGQGNWVFIACETDVQFKALSHLMERPEIASDARFATNENRVKNQDALDEIIQEWTTPQSRYEIMDLCQKAGIIAGAMQTGEDRVEFDPQLRKRGVFPVVPHAYLGDNKVEAYPVRLSKTSAAIRRGAPLWREHNRYVFGDLLGLSTEDMVLLEADGVI